HNVHYRFVGWVGERGVLQVPGTRSHGLASSAARALLAVSCGVFLARIALDDSDSTTLTAQRRSVRLALDVESRADGFCARAVTRCPAQSAAGNDRGVRVWHGAELPPWMAGSCRSVWHARHSPATALGAPQEMT